jgi:aspartate/methionine/tyrosine aminotransferase
LSFQDDTPVALQVEAVRALGMGRPAIRSAHGRGLLLLEDSLAATVLRENGVELETMRQILQKQRII